MKRHTTLERLENSSDYKNPGWDEGGFTLLELLVAISIFAIGMLSLAMLQSSSIKHNTTARDIGTADKWAIDQIERLVAADWDSAVLAENSGDWHSETRTDTPGGRQYTVQWQVADNEPAANIKTVNLVVATSQLSGDSSREYTFLVRPH